MIKKFKKSFMPLVLLFSSKAFCNQMPSEDMPDCPEVDLIEQSSMPNPEDALRNCCKEKCKKCKCEKFCKLLVSKNLKTESLSVVKNATIGGNLAVTGSTTLNGSYPVLNQYEQIYNIRGIILAQAVTVSYTVGSYSHQEGAYPLAATITPSSFQSLGEGFTISSMTGSGAYYHPKGTNFTGALLNFSINVTFDKPFTRTPSIAATMNEGIPITTVVVSLADVSLDVTKAISNASPTGFTFNVQVEATFYDAAATGDERVPPTSAILNLLADYSQFALGAENLNFIVDGVITPSAPVCPPCPTVKPSCCR